MSELPISSKYRSTPDAPVSDDERESLSARLNEAFSAGRLSQEEFQAGLDQLFAATRLGQLVPVLGLLPAKATYETPAIVAQEGTPGELTPARSAVRPAVAITAAVVAVAMLLAALSVLLVLL